MISIKDLFIRSRMLAGDMGKTKYDDYELLTAINAAVDMLVNTLVVNSSPELIRRCELTLDADAQADLPQNFRALVNLTEKGSMFDSHSNFFENEQPEYSYRIEGNKLVLPKDKASTVYVLAYHKAPAVITLEDIWSGGTLDLDSMFGNVLAAMTNNILSSELSAAEEKAQKAVVDSRYNKRGAMFTPPLWSGRVSNR